MRTLAVIGEVKAAHDIEGADRIHSLEVYCGEHGTWRGVASKDIHEGDSVVVFLQDALLPSDDPRFAFMASHKFRVKMCRFKGAPSEALIVPNDSNIHTVGADVTSLYRVQKYEKPIPESMNGEALGAFPTYACPITDEPNFQTVPHMVERMAQDPFYITEKADGTSCTVWNDANGLHVCSRNYELREFSTSHPEKSNTYWRMARKFAMHDLPHDLFFQMEIVGPNIQGNPLGLNEHSIRVFSIYDSKNRKYLPYSALKELCEEWELPTARLISLSEPWDHVPSSEELQKLAEIRYPNGRHGEGIVIRAQDSSWSFKVINLLYKEK